MRLFSAATLSTRVTKTVTLLTFCLFILFSLVTFFIAYSLEDAMFNHQLQYADNQLQQTDTLPPHINKVADLTAFGFSTSNNNPLLGIDTDEPFGEFSYGKEHYHYMKISDGLLLMNVTEQFVVKRGAKDILLILFLLFIPCIAASVFIAKSISSHALKPFHRLSQHFQLRSEQGTSSSEQLIDIEEADIKAIAEQLEQALTKQAQLIEEQTAFNQGMSHEIRTPLQVMDHSLELIEVNQPALYQQASMQRLVRSLARIKRISNALLWLTSKDQFQAKSNINKVLDKVILESKALSTLHKLDISLENTAQYPTSASIPEEVIELIFFNLINNAIHHGLHCEGALGLNITIEQHGITFTNAIANELEHELSKQQHFNLGLTLIKNLAERFSHHFTTEVTNNHFSATLSFSQPVNER
ncbi:sensor histidine kinase KdpD [Shewanella sp. UCD-KL12]|uniref:sensor histidine kinase n=1 Tax=Shewanella sp. UCD-KL12 TaxID=1917163 RepID=UPI0009706CBF|nr:histidine kinase dimerization/phospho-acceptor domain-containing protein [Shewanella sp. UCD-KL12]